MDPFFKGQKETPGINLCSPNQTSTESKGATFGSTRGPTSSFREEGAEQQRSVVFGVAVDPDRSQRSGSVFVEAPGARGSFKVGPLGCG